MRVKPAVETRKRNWSHRLPLWGFLSALLLTGGCTADFPLSLIGDSGTNDNDAALPDTGLQDAAPDSAPADTGVDVLVVDCGNGTLDPGEGCDDGNTTELDGCDSACQLEGGWSCAGAPSVCDSICGDGIVVGAETCDDNNTTNGDGCNDQCEVECSNGSTTDCNMAGQTVNPAAAFVDPEPPTDYVQCAGFANSPGNDVGPNWDANCFGATHTIRIRYWDTSGATWVLLGDATLIPDSLATYGTEVFDAVNAGGGQGVLETGGVTILKDDPGVMPVTTWVCNPGHPNQEYSASDLYFANQANTATVTVCGFSEGDDAAATCFDEDEILLSSRAYEVCGNGGGQMELAVAIYYHL
ncbi:MAG: DUF4215 domain-containing protein [bacterium]